MSELRNGLGEMGSGSLWVNWEVGLVELVSGMGELGSRIAEVGRVH